jgi:hypothetical protein
MNSNYRSTTSAISLNDYNINLTYNDITLDDLLIFGKSLLVNYS